MKKITHLIFLLIFATSFAQKKFNQFSVEAGYGYLSTINSFSPTYNSDFSGFNHFEVGARYMFTEKFGVKIDYANDLFENNKGGKRHTKQNKFRLQGIYNIGKEIFNTRTSEKRFGLLAHSGFGMVYSSPWILEGKSESYEKIANFTLGITPQVKISKYLALYADASYNYNFLQSYGVDGLLKSKDYKYFKYGFLNFSIGLNIYLGEHREHADWY